MAQNGEEAKDVDIPGDEKTARICNLLVLSGLNFQKWWSWRERPILELSR